MTAAERTSFAAPVDDGAPVRSPGPSWYRSAGAFVLWMLLHSISVFPRNPLAMRDGAPLVPIFPPLVGLIYNLAIAGLFVWWFVLRGGPEADYRRATFRLNAPPTQALRRLPFVAIALVLIVFASLVVVPKVIPFPADKGDPLEAYLQLPFGLITVLSLASIVVPLVEEFLFRGWVQSRLERKLSPALAIVIAATIFGVVHFQVFGLPVRIIFGMTAGYYAWATRSIWPGVLLHAVYNGVLLGGGTATPGVDEHTLLRWSETPSVFWPALLVFVASVAALIMLLRGVEPVRDDVALRER